jgi:hypothetical protein
LAPLLERGRGGRLRGSGLGISRAAAAAASEEQRGDRRRETWEQGSWESTREFREVRKEIKENER